MRLLLLFLLFGSATSWAQLLQIEVIDAQTNARLEESFAVLKGSAPLKSNNGIITNLPDDAIIESPGYVDRFGINMVTPPFPCSR